MRFKLLLLLLYVKTSLADAAPKKKVAASEPAIASDNYNFGYEIGTDNSHKFHKEVGDGTGRKIGSYGFTDADGRQRVVQYIADENGFRVQIKTNEPGTNSYEAASSKTQKRPSIMALEDKDSPMTLPVKMKESKRLKDNLISAPTFHSPVLPNGPVRMYTIDKSSKFAPAAQSIEYKPHPKAIQIGPLLNVIGTPVPMQSPILPLGPVKMVKYEPTGAAAPPKYEAPIPFPQEAVPAALVQDRPKFEPLRLSSAHHIPTHHPAPILHKDLETSQRFDPAKFNILSMYTLLPNGPKMYDGPVHAYVKPPIRTPPQNGLIYEGTPRKSRRRVVVRQKKHGSDALQTTENGLELSQTIHDSSTVFYVPAEHAPPVRRRLAKPIFKKKRQPLQHGDGSASQELTSPLTGHKDVVYDDPVGDLKPVPLFKGTSVTGFLPPSGKLTGPSEAYRLVKPPVGPYQVPAHEQSSLRPLQAPSPAVIHRPTPQHLPPAQQAPPLQSLPPQIPHQHHLPSIQQTVQNPAVIHNPTHQIQGPPHPGLEARSFQRPPEHQEPLYQSRLVQPPPLYQPSVANPGTPVESFKIPSYPKLTEIERAAALKLVEHPLHIPQLAKEVPQAIEHQRQPNLAPTPQFPRGVQQDSVPNFNFQGAPAEPLHPQQTLQARQRPPPPPEQQHALHDYYSRQTPTFLQNQGAIVSRYQDGALRHQVPTFEQYKTTDESFREAERKEEFKEPPPPRSFQIPPQSAPTFSSPPVHLQQSDVHVRPQHQRLHEPNAPPHQSGHLQQQAPVGHPPRLQALLGPPQGPVQSTPGLLQAPQPPAQAPLQFAPQQQILSQSIPAQYPQPPSYEVNAQGQLPPQYQISPSPHQPQHPPPQIPQHLPQHQQAVRHFAPPPEQGPQIQSVPVEQLQQAQRQQLPQQLQYQPQQLQLAPQHLQAQQFRAPEQHLQLAHQQINLPPHAPHHIHQAPPGSQQLQQLQAPLAAGQQLQQLPLHLQQQGQAGFQLAPGRVAEQQQQLLQRRPELLTAGPLHYPLYSTSHLQSQASSEESRTFAQQQQQHLGAQAFISDRRPKSLADHSPFEYIKKSS
ncbi:bromodomain-containing protein 4-like [Galendromus occidentalis]|uniref:Bromodomain-containing protein 4-like n=1 Tax=Galendromus occidentalis TaxID=34638 RepID=A0AAJ7SI14_9ACAR|nr:bromodomain-containing protein 4-like [Galendromus occidentalis]